MYPALASLDARIHLSCRNSFTGQQRYVRYDTVTGLKDIHTTSWAGDTMQLNSLDGFCTAANAPDQTVYCVGRRASDTNPNEPSNRLAVLASYDNGQTWHDFATTDDLGFVPYGITGAREIRDGHIIGMFTLLGTPGASNIVQFFRIPVTTPTSQRLYPVSVTTNAYQRQ